MKQRRTGNKQQKNNAGLKAALRGKSGITLIELIVTFALISLFAVSCTQIISKSVGVYHKIRGLNYALQVSDTLMEKISGGIEGAWNVPLNKESGDSTAVRITDSADMIELTDRTESHVCITTTGKKEKIPNYENTSGTYANNQLLIYYYSVEGQTPGEDGYKPVDWTYDEAVYMGFSVKNLTFEQPALTESADYGKNIIKVTMELYSDKYGTFKSERYVHCYNFDDEQDAENIKSNGGSPGGGTEGGGSEGGGSEGGGSEPENPETPGGNSENGGVYPGTDKFNPPLYYTADMWPDAQKWPDWGKLDSTGIFYHNGSYYMVYTSGDISKSEVEGGPENAPDWRVRKITGTIYTKEDFDVWDNQRTDLHNGDIYYDAEKQEYYLRAAGEEPGTDTYPEGSKETNNWKIIPNILPLPN